MPDKMEKIARDIAQNQAFDGYSAWRMLKEVNSEIFRLERNKSAVPIGLVRLRWLISKARELRKRAEDDQGHSGTTGSGGKCTAASAVADGFDAFDFVDHYRALGGRRVAWAMADRIRLGAMDDDTPDAARFWTRTWSNSGSSRREAISNALLIRGRY